MPTPEDNYRTITLTQGQVSLVDAEDYDALSRHKWSACWSKCTRTFRAVRGTAVGGKQDTIAMPRQIMGVPPGDKRRVDHWNHDTLDNRKKNLRVCETRHNARNVRTHRDNKSGFKGVFPMQTGGYCAQICVDGKKIHLGCRRTAEEASLLYMEAAKKYHGEYACMGT